MTEAWRPNEDESTVLTLPHSDSSQAEIDRFLAELSLQFEFQSGARIGWHEYGAQLPVIIGEVPEKERAFFTSFMPPFRFRGSFSNDNTYEEEYVRAIRSRMPTVVKCIEDDIARFGNPDVRLDSVLVESVFARAGTAPRAAVDLHIDSLKYLVSNLGGTEFYTGNARARYSSFVGQVDPNSLNPNSLVVAAPPFAIVRKGPWVIHRTPTFKRDAERTLMIFSPREVSPKA